MILVLGPNGTLGQAVMERLLLDCVPRIGTSARIHVWSDMKRVISQLPMYSVIINCAGDIHRDPVDEDRMYAANVTGPRVVAHLADLYGHYVIHVSTDCVFHGQFSEIHDVGDYLTPSDFYGWSKAVGEPSGGRIVNVRTSFIAPTQGIWADALGNKPLVGWSGVMWSGGTVTTVARALVSLAVHIHDLNGEDVDGPEDIAGVENVDGKRIVHLATEIPVSKFDVLKLLAPHKPIVNEPFPCYSRALVPTITLPPLVEQIASEATGG